MRTIHGILAAKSTLLGFIKNLQEPIWAACVEIPFSSSCSGSNCPHQPAKWSSFRCWETRIS